MFPENRPDNINLSLKGIGFGFYLPISESVFPAMAQSRAPNQMMTEGYLNWAGGRLGSMDVYD